MTTIALKRPIRLSDTSPEIAQLTFREMEAGDLRGIKQDDPMGATLDVAKKLCQEIPAVIEKLKGPDFKAVAAYVAVQMEDFQ